MGLEKKNPFTRYAHNNCVLKKWHTLLKSKLYQIWLNSTKNGYYAEDGTQLLFVYLVNLIFFSKTHVNFCLFFYVKW